MTTGGKYKFAEKLADKMAWGYRGKMVYEFAEKRIENKQSIEQIRLDMISDIIGTLLPGFYGVAWDLGWQGGRWVTQQPTYMEFKANLLGN